MATRTQPSPPFFPRHKPKPEIPSPPYCWALDPVYDAVDYGCLSELDGALAVACHARRSKRYAREMKCTTLSVCVREGRLDMTRHLLEKYPNHMDYVTPKDVMEKFSLPILELLHASGWDINQDSSPRFRNNLRLIDLACHDEPTVRWLVDHGAEIDFERDETYVFGRFHLPLEHCAMRGSVATFRFLQAKGAKLGKWTLHPRRRDRHRCQPSDEDKAKRKLARSEMLYFLVDELKLDINGKEADVPQMMQWGTPLHNATMRKNGEAVMKWLLEMGADPCIKNRRGLDAEQLATECKIERALAVFKDWKTAHESSN
ncbi:hypothetical protein B0J13DRAFT_523742 [Dactylonectria estremocensis]|uniref:Ankyrin n=1 Tax=Dactylonectria estremocensis TaxID=1079267 RepID=A0A9P9EZQ2_9HYPO|nr:hypothetical protein B0J13DRAFT_523742 [Dactylonectria estremocensis]